MKRKIFGILFALVLVLSFSLVTAVPVSAAISITLVTPTDIPVGPAYTALTGPEIVEGAAGDISSTGTIILTAPAGFEFDTGSDVTATVTVGDLKLGTGQVSQTETPLASTITIDVFSVSIVASTIEYSGINIRDTDNVAGTTGSLEFSGTAGVTGSAGTLTSVAGAATQLAFEVDPAGSVSGLVFGTQPTIEAQDQFGNKDTTFGDNITISVKTGGGTLLGTATQAMAAGTLTTTLLGYTATADQEDFTLAADDDGFHLTQGVSGGVTCDVVATKLVFTTQPAGSVSGSALTTQPVVEAQDAGNLLDIDYVTGVVASENDLGTLAGTLTVTPALGIATFTDLVYTATANGETFQIDVTSGGLIPATSNDVVSVLPTWGGGGAVPPTPTIETNLFGEVFRFRFHITTRGEIRDTIQATSADGNLTLTIPAGTTALDKNGKPLSTLTSGVDVSPPPPPSHIIGLAYNFGPDGATFDPPITLTWSYDPDALPEGVAEEDLVILWYDEEAGEWVECDFTCAPETDCVTGYVCHFTTFAIIAHPVPAAFSASNLSIQPPEVQPKEAVTITLSVANTGGTEGSYAVVLKINGVKEAEKNVTVAAGSSQGVSFSVTREKAGSYSVAVNGLSGSFTVKEPVPTPAPPPTPPPEVTPPFPWPLVGGIIAAVVVVGLLIFFLVVRRRA